MNAFRPLLLMTNVRWMRRVVHMNVTVQIAVERIGEAIHALQLKGCMRDVVAMSKNLIDLTLNLRACTDMNIIGKDVCRHGPQALRKTPNMDIMDAKHAVHSR